MKATKLTFSALTLLSLTCAFASGCGDDRKVVKKDVEDKPRLLGGHTHNETTVYRNADGSTSTEKESIKTP